MLGYTAYSFKAFGGSRVNFGIETVVAMVTKLKHYTWVQRTYSTSRLSAKCKALLTSF